MTQIFPDLQYVLLYMYMAETAHSLLHYKTIQYDV
jgi:hypothetical protein